MSILVYSLGWPQRSTKLMGNLDIFLQKEQPGSESKKYKR